MADELRLGTLGDEIFAAPAAPDAAVLQGDGMSVPVPLQADLPTPPHPFATGDGMTVPVPLQDTGDGMSVPVPLRSGDLDILGNGPSIPIP